MQRTKKLCLIAIILFICASGCAPERTARVSDDPLLNKADRYYIPQVPFIKQRKNFCGPASIAAVLNYWGKDISQDDVASELYIAPAKGTLNIDIAGYVMKHGLWAQEYNADFEGLKPYIRANIPVVVLQELGLAPLVKYHYSILIGYDDANKFVILHTARSQDKKVGYRNFKSSWKHAGNWALIVAPPEDVAWQLDPSAHNRLGNLCERIERFDLALLHYNEVIRQRPKEPLGYFNAGNVYLKKGDFEEAVSYYKKALSFSPDNADFYNNLACAELELGRIKDAERNVNKALSLNPKARPYYLDTLAMVYLKKGQYNDALASLNEAKRLAADDKEILDTIDKHLKLAIEKRMSEGN